MDWIIRNPARFLRERQELEDLGREVDWLLAAVWKFQATTVCVDVDIVAGGKTYEAQLVYPDCFPGSPVYVRPRNGTDNWSGHQYANGGSLCLEYRADNWDDRITGAVQLRSAYRLLSTENDPIAPAVVQSDHRETKGQSLRPSRLRLVCTPELLNALASLPPTGAARTETYSIIHPGLTIVIPAKIGTGAELSPVSDVPSALDESGPLFCIKRDGCVIRNADWSDKHILDSVEALQSLVNELFDEFLLRDSESGWLLDQIVLLQGSDPASIQAFTLIGGEHSFLRECTVVLPEEPAQRLHANTRKLADCHVCIVGLGSLGSKIAVSLARTGVRRFLLVDDDILLPGNLVRHQLGWESVGVHKADATKEIIVQLIPDADVVAHNHRIAGQESAMRAAAVLKDVAACDVIIDATADASVFLTLASVARSYRRCLCWGEIFAGGVGGMIARAWPKMDAHPLAIRAGIQSFLNTQLRAPFQQAAGYDLDAAIPLVASDADICMIAASLTSLVLDVICDVAVTSFPYPAYLIGFRKEWIFDAAFDTQPIAVTVEPWEEESLDTVSGEVRDAALHAIVEMLTAK